VISGRGQHELGHCQIGEGGREERKSRKKRMGRINGQVRVKLLLLFENALKLSFEAL